MLWILSHLNISKQDQGTGVLHAESWTAYYYTIQRRIALSNRSSSSVSRPQVLWRDEKFRAKKKVRKEQVRYVFDDVSELGVRVCVSQCWVCGVRACVRACDCESERLAWILGIVSSLHCALIALSPSELEYELNMYVAIKNGASGFLAYFCCGSRLSLSVFIPGCNIQCHVWIVDQCVLLLIL